MELPEVIRGYIDSLTALQRRRIIFAKRWCRGALVNGIAARCLVGHAEFAGTTATEALKSDEALDLTSKRLAVMMAFDGGYRANGESFIDAIKAYATAANDTAEVAV